ncbi:PspC domain-containing protein [Atopococcus tabaci]|uniref:PspC domain-containing protein n=1 Tax=Atopococcus tabaci TaxID=269774 RepID=UPI000427274D|nr:PspC domain-containing protein [Atopococcus tabaci]
MKRLKKSRHNAVIFGVLGGLGEYFNIDPVILRVIVVVLTFIGVGSTVPLYLILALVMPDDERGPRSSGSNRDWNRPRGGSGRPSPSQKRKEAEKVEEDDWSDF